MEIHWICDLFDHLSLNTATQNSTSMFSIEMFSLCSLFDGLSISGKSDKGIQVGDHILQKFGDSESSGGFTTTGKDFRTANSFQVVNGGISDELGLSQVNYFDCFFILLLFIKTSENRISTRQVKLDLYLFYRENCGINPKMTKSSSCLILRKVLTTGTWLREISHQIMLNYYLFCRNWIGTICLGLREDVGKYSLCLDMASQCSVCTCYVLVVSSSIHLEDLFYIQSIFLISCDCWMGVSSLLMLDIPLCKTIQSLYTGFPGTVAVSTYIWRKYGLHFIDGHRGIVWKPKGLFVEVVLLCSAACLPKLSGGVVYD